MGHMIMSIVILVFGIVFFANSFGFPELQGGALPDAGVWPRIIAALLIVCSVLALIDDIKKWKKSREIPDSQKPKKEEAEGYDPKGRVRMIGSVIILGLYSLVGLRYMGFVSSTLVVIPAIMLWLGERKWLRIVLLDVIMTILCVFLFCKFMLIPLPRGMGIFRNISLLFY